MNKRQIGTVKEKLAKEYLENQGLQIIACNYRNRFGEIDLIARDKEYYVFIEVKYRKTASLGHPEEAVNYHKAYKISKVADYYRVVNKLSYDTPVRFDVVAIEGDVIRWHQNAFMYLGN